MIRLSSPIRAFAASALMSSIIAAVPASAAVTAITSSSTILHVSLKVGGSPVDVGPALPASGSAPPAYNVTNAFASYSNSFSTPLGELSFSTGVLTDSASGDIASAAGAASSALAALDIELDSLFSLTADAVASEASVDGTPSASGSATLANFVLTVLGSSISIGVDPSPNDVIFDKFGVKVTLNEQTHEVEGGFGEGFVVNAIAIDIDGFGVKGFIDIGQSKASISLAPVLEASTWGMMAIGFAGLAFAYRRKAMSAIVGL